MKVLKYVIAAVLLMITTFAGVAASVTALSDPFAPACRPVVTQPYGPTSLEGEPVIGGVRFHTGVDLACPLGTPVHSVTNGLAHVVTGWGSGFGNNVVVEVVMSLPGDAAPQTYFVRYAHLLADIPIADGAPVQVGEVIGFEGSTGFSTGPHLHFEVDRHSPAVTNSIDPAPLLPLLREGPR